ncbi:hypothetical protein [Chryseobacterium sp. G0186]|uniref:hypothetical protein n=1 Tax=Chryseobacterium sp. G0186 TaxID=2487064 RepID=UPI000F51393F|nr:hypothetical protein [Chryseobacterium sp. G0186]
MIKKRYFFVLTSFLLVCLFSCKKAVKTHEIINTRDSIAVDNYLQRSYNLRIKDSINGKWEYSDRESPPQVVFNLSLEKAKDNDSIKGNYFLYMHGKIGEEGAITGIVTEKKAVIEFYLSSYPDKGKAELLDWNEENHYYMNWKLIKSPIKSSVPEKCKLTKVTPREPRKLSKNGCAYPGIVRRRIK